MPPEPKELGRKRQVSFGDTASHDGASASASDDDAVEVSFDSQDPYRRKSSIVAFEATSPHLRRDRCKTQCIVHQFLESQQRAHDAPGDKHQTAPPDELSHELGHDRLVEPKGSDPPAIVLTPPDPRKQQRRGSPVNSMRDRCRIIMDADVSDNSDVGQIDEKSWKREFNRPLQTGSAQLDDSESDHSRYLTKKQLSDMAWGVRELSRRLGSLRLKFRAKNIFLLTKPHDRDLIPKARQLCKWLMSKERDVRYTVFIEHDLKQNGMFDADGLVAELAKDYVTGGEMAYGDDLELATQEVKRRLRCWNENMCRTRGNMFDFIITLGGDGTVLYASWLFQRIVPPVISFALGSLGFLTKFDFSDYEKILTTAFHDGVTVSLRLRFEGTVMRSQRKRLESIKEGSENGVDAFEEEHKLRDLVEEIIGEEKDDEYTHHPDGTFEILNEIVVDRGPNPTMSTTEIFGDDEHFTTVMADGVTVSTPTGSTAYNLAAGGSLCHPENPVMLVTAICAHTLSFRPIILPDTIVLRVGVPYDSRTSSWASFDGRERIELKPGDYVTISASRYPFASVTPRGRRSQDWVNSISAKLGWNSRTKQKAFKEWDKETKS